MPIGGPNQPPAPLSYTVGDICTDALIEIGAHPPGEPLDAEEAQWSLRKANYLFDVWGALRGKVFSFAFNVYTLTPALSPHTIGPSGQATFATTGPRPVKIESAALLLPGSNGPFDQIIKVRDAAWWAAQQAKSIQNNIPTDLFYNPASPDGQIYFWPVPNAASQVRLQTWQSVTQFVAITDPIGGPNGPGTLPPGYRAAMMYSLAEELCPGAKKTPSPALVAAALRARNAVFGNNMKSPRTSTQDSGMPRSGTGRRSDFNYLTGGKVGGRPE
jgi:hypothetical protein